MKIVTLLGLLIACIMLECGIVSVADVRDDYVGGYPPCNHSDYKEVACKVLSGYDVKCPNITGNNFNNVQPYRDVLLALQHACTQNGCQNVHAWIRSPNFCEHNYVTPDN